jgi:hypothetical protein
VKGIIDTMKSRQGKDIFDDDVSILEIEFASSGEEIQDLREA